ncbi:DUF6078 family protein [uncultured Bacteroides sp.]|uniref:DUF6078 family protein n=1 Tax=uncultured Bacteroides sp. TaxID=162156 RepID=UPI002603CAB2|nr:DUF6078 family protein [uncultured Bacteroides sp.]
MIKKLKNTIPTDYATCLLGDCQQAGNCLRQLAYQAQTEKETFLRIINPNQCATDGKCPFYRNATPVRYAYGFTGIQKQMFPGQYDIFRTILSNHFGRNAYFQRRKGEIALSPNEQATVLKALKQAGVTEDLSFDRYENSYNWYE